MTSKRIVLITGVSREEGIGFGIAKAFLEKDFHIIITARKVEKAEALVEKLGEDSNMNSFPLDITDRESVNQLARQVEEEFGRLDVLINNAGAGFDMGVHPLETDIDVSKNTLETNLYGAWRMIQAFYSLLKKSEHPRVVNISSGAGSFGDPVFGLGVHPAIVSSYGISKLALNGLTVKFARQFKEENILINAICPGFVATAPGMKEMGARSVDEAVEGIVWAATLPDDGPTGEFFRDMQPLPW